MTGGGLAAIAEITTTVQAVQAILPMFSFSLALQVGMARFENPNVLRLAMALGPAVVNALMATMQVAAELGLLTVLVPGAGRMALATLGAFTAYQGALLWSE